MPWILPNKALAAQVSIVDDRGVTIHLEQPASRIVALYAAFAEILEELGQTRRLLACAGSDTALPAIGTHLQPNAERILALSPDLVVQMGGRGEGMESVRYLEGLGLKVAVFNLESFEQLFSACARLGALMDVKAQANDMVRAMRAELDQIQTRQHGPKPRIFFEVRYPNLLAAGQKSIVSEIIARAGGENAVTAPDKLARLGEEEVLRLAPDIYLTQQGPMNPRPVPVAERSLWRTLDCVRTGQFFVVDQHLFSRPGPRTVDAVRQLAGIIGQWQAGAKAP